ncbi:MAG: hypothetical protein R3E39_11085 [Anaerolineae bacterium]
MPFTVRRHPYELLGALAGGRRLLHRMSYSLYLRRDGNPLPAPLSIQWRG